MGMEFKDFLIWVTQAVFLTLILTSGHAHALTEADVFDWWDAGLITPDEAEEMLALLDEGNENEACLLAQVYAQEECEIDTGANNGNRKSSGPKKSASKARKKNAQPSASRKKENARPSLAPHGYVMWKARLDSTGRLESHREEIQVSFYRYSLRLGSQELLMYQNDGSEAYFGEISTRELHSHFPLDTLWGAAALYPLGKFYLAALLDTSRTVQARGGYAFNHKNYFEGLFWLRKNHETREIYSGALQTKFDFGKLSTWWEYGQKAPLVKVELSSTKNAPPNASSKNAPTLSWKTTAYYHGDSVPEFARLSATILKSRFWGSQTISAFAREFANTKLSVNARFINPLHSDSISTRLKAAIQSGPDFLRGSASVTCLSANENCPNMDWQAQISSKIANQWLLEGKMRGKRTEFSVKFWDIPQNFAKIAIILPDGTLNERLQIQNQAHFSADFLDFALTATFKSEKGLHFHPSHASVYTKISF